MSEESMLILTMLGDGKITAEQADSLLRAVREPAAAPAAPPLPAPRPLPALEAPLPPVAPVPPAPPSPETLDAMQAKLAELQGKIGELQGKLGEAQGKLGAAQAAHSADGGVEFWAGKVADFLPNIDVNKIMDEAMKGFGALKSDAVRAAREAARQAAHEARRAAREASQNAREAGQEARRAGRHGRHREWKFEFNWDGPKSEGMAERPENHKGWPEAEDTAQTTVNWVGAERLVLINPYGNVKAVGRDDLQNQAEATVTKTAWAETEADARVLLQQVFLTHRTENGEVRLEIIAPDDGRKRIAVDYEVFVPTNIALDIQTTHGEAEAEETASALTMTTVSGEIAVRRPVGTLPGDARLSSRSGEVTVEQWDSPQGDLAVETVSGEVQASGVRCGQSATFFTKSGDLTVEEMQIAGELRVDSLSGEIKLAGGTVGATLAVKTQSGEIAARNLRAAALSLESVSGDVEASEVSGVLTVKSVSGDLEVKDLRSQSVALTTVSGDAELAFAAPFTGSLAGTTVSGDLTVALWDNSEARIELNTMSGDLECELPLSDKTENGKRLAGTLGAGTGSLRLQSVSGDLKIEPQE